MSVSHQGVAGLTLLSLKAGAPAHMQQQLEWGHNRDSKRLLKIEQIPVIG